MNVAGTCLDCGGQLPGGPWGRRCPRCLFRLGLTDSATSDDASFPEGADSRRLADYELVEEVGRGGMGVVYRARQLRLDRIVALKLLLIGRWASPESVRRFQREAQSAGRLHHPNIVATHDYGIADGQAFLSMDWVAGVDLGEMIRDHPLPPEIAARHLRAVAEAVHYAHTQGILHRDLKPSNVLIDAEGQPRLTDFGLAKPLGEAMDLTLTGQPLGSPNYMAPEQAAGRHDAVRPAADIYALGAILYHCLTGQPPFRSESLSTTLRMVQESDPVAPRLLVPTIPRDLEVLCLKCLEKQPSRRFATAQELVEELERFLAGDPVRSRPIGMFEKSGRWCRRNPRLAISSGALAALVVVVVVGAPVATLRIDHERRKALHYAEEATRQEQQAKDTLRRFQLQQARERLANDDSAGALTILTSLLRQNASDRGVAEWLMTELTHRSFALPTSEPLQHADRVFSARVSPDGRRILTTSRDNRAQLWDPSSGRTVGPALQHDSSHVRPGEYLSGLHPIRAAFSPDGSQVVTASMDGTARVWNVLSGEPVTPPLAHANAVTCAGFSPDGAWVVTGTKDGRALFYDSRTGESVGPRLRHDGWVNVVAYSPDGTLLLTASDDLSARLWRMPSGEPTGVIVRHFQSVRHAAFDLEGRRFVTASGEGVARIWDAATGTPRTPPLQHAAALNHAEFSPDGARLVTASRDQTARLWDAATGQPIGVPLQHQGAVRDARFSPEGYRVVTASEDQTARVWDARTGEPLTEPFRHQGEVWSATFTLDGTQVLTASSDRTVATWDVRPGGAVGLANSRYRNVIGVSWSRDGRQILATSLASAIVLDAVTGLPVNYRALEHHAELVAAEFSPDEQRIVTAATDGSIRLWNTQTSELLPSPTGHRDKVFSATFSPDGRRIVTASADGTARVWDAGTAAAIGPSMGHDAEVFEAVFSPDGHHVATASADRTARVFEAGSSRLMSGPFLHRGEVTRVRFSPLGRLLLTVSGDGMAHLWDVESGRPQGNPLRHEGAIRDARFSADGRRVVTASQDRTVRIWRVDSGEPVSTPLRHPAAVRSAAFDAEGRRVVTGADGGWAMVWDSDTGQPLGGAFRHRGNCNVARFRPDGRWIATGGSDWMVRTWEIPAVPTRIPDWLLDLGEAVIGQKLRADGSLEALPIEECRRRLQVATAKSQEMPGNDWVRWFLGDRLMRPASPSADRTVAFWIGQQTYDSYGSSGPDVLGGLRRALHFSPNDVEVATALARVAATADPQQNPLALAESDWLSRRALGLRSDRFDTWWARATYLGQVDRLPEAIVALDQAVGFAPDNVGLLRFQAQVLGKAGRTEEADAVLTRAMEITTRNGEPHAMAAVTLERARLYQHAEPGSKERSRFLEILRIPARAPTTPAALIDLTSAYNAGCSQRWLWGGQWDDLAALGSGRQRIAGIEFDVRGVVQLTHVPPTREATGYPERIEGIVVGRSGRRLHFLHGATDTAEHGEPIASYLVEYEDRERHDIEIQYGRDVLAWTLEPPPDSADTGKPRARAAWTGPGRVHRQVRLYVTTWENPRPEVPIASLGFVSRLTGSAPFLVAVTVEP